jgi:hypothetical protein
MRSADQALFFCAGESTSLVLKSCFNGTSTPAARLRRVPGVA